MFKIDIKESTAVYDTKIKKPEVSEGGVFYLATPDDVAHLTSVELLDAFNAAARSAPALKVSETARFSTRAAGERRLWGLLVGIRADKEDPGEVAKSQNDGKPPKPKRVRKAKKAKTPKPKKPREPRGPRKAVDKDAPPGKKVYPPKEGSLQDTMLKLLTKPGGIPIEKFVEKLNAIPGRKGKNTIGGIWAGIRYMLHVKHGYGLRCIDGVLSAYTE